MSLFVKLEVGWLDNPKLIRAGMVGRGIHASAMCQAKRSEDDGWFDRLLLIRDGATDDQIDQLSGTLLEMDGDMVRPIDWHDRNPSQAAIDARRASKSDAGKAGNHARYGHPGDLADCPRCTKKPQVTRTDLADGSQSARTTLAEASPETETETETTHTRESPGTKLALVEPPGSSADADGDGFDDWWKGYPRKVDKAKARSAWTKALKGRNAPTPEILTDRLRVQIRRWRTEGRPQDKIPHATTWLNGRRWEDDDLIQSPHPSPGPVETYDHAALGPNEVYR